MASVKVVAQKGQLHPLQRGEYALIGMYGPPPGCKGKTENGVGLRQCIRPRVESAIRAMMAP
jgi:hypothetical protein